jgi:hypothetical protein
VARRRSSCRTSTSPSPWSGTADNGTTFGAAIDLDENAGAVGTNDAGVTIFITGDYGTLTMGDTDGALDWAMQEVDLNAAGVDQRRPHDAPRLQWQRRSRRALSTARSCVTITASAISRLAVSLEHGRQHVDAGEQRGRLRELRAFWAAAFFPPNLTTADPIWGIGARYSGAFAGGTFGVGVGYQFTDDAIDAIPA